ncbi:MAG: TolC family protein [Dysgonomonas sp.]|nr:TolC family protein [Dysgonomonas sp.]
MKRYLLFLICSLICSRVTYSQEVQYRKLSCKEIEALFIENNLILLAERYNIDIADAAVAQAKLWDNPTLSISDVNLWSTKRQRGEISDIASSSFTKNTEFSIELSQLIQTANKRGKLIRREKVSKEIALQEFEDVLRNLKIELRKSIYDLHYAQTYMAILTNQLESISRLVESFKNQVQQGNIAKSELLRLQSSLLELENEINTTRADLGEQKKSLKILLNIDPFVQIEIADNPEKTINPDKIILQDLMQLAEDSRPDMKQYRLHTQFHKRTLDYEKSQRIPDITLSANYDRYGGVWKDFIGFGVSIDLPFFNRNQGNIKAAKLNIDQSSYLEQQHKNIIRHEVMATYNNYVNAYRFYTRITEDSLLPELDNMLEVYSKNLLNKNISMLEYIDFMEAYRTNKQTILTAQKNVNLQFEELQYMIGTEIK